MRRPRGTQLSRRDARRLAISAQGLGRPRPTGGVGRHKLLGVFDAVGTIQLDAINVIERTQFLVLFSRLGAYDRTRVHTLTGPGGALFEYWAHAASLLPMAHQPLFRWRMAKHGPYGNGPTSIARWAAWLEEHGDYVKAILQEVRDRGPLAASQLEDPRRRAGEWWDRRSIGRQALEYLFFKGEVAGWRAPNFERVYDVPERVVPRAVLTAPTPTAEDAQRELVHLAARALGVATVRDLATYYFTNVKATAARVAELVEAGTLERAGVEGWKEPGYMLAGSRVARPRREHATLLSPFDSLIWDRARTLRLFGFDYRIEVYTPPPKRKYGYYVMPLLLGDELVGRFDLKADRGASTLRVQAAHLESGADPAVVAPAARDELDALRAWLELEGVSVARRGNLADPLRSVLRASV
jgi:uncharacterized protein YcaQ